MLMVAACNTKPGPNTLPKTRLCCSTQSPMHSPAAPKASMTTGKSPRTQEKV